ncbi:MAG: dual specificity protein phosphatase family protein [Actinomycetota bacterium]|jgi:hypothetical protein
MTTSVPTTSIGSDLLPTVRNLEEARLICGDFTSVLTVGPESHEVDDFGHPDHKVVSFDDITVNYRGYLAPTFDLVKEAVEWGVGRTNLLVHCHAGMSRSTSTAWGIAIANGFDPMEAFDLLKQNHPVELHRTWTLDEHHPPRLARRAFIPNELVLKHLERYFGLRSGTLRDIASGGALD